MKTLKRISDRAMFRAATRQLRQHLNNRPLTKAEVSQRMFEIENEIDGMRLNQSRLDPFEWSSAQESLRIDSHIFRLQSERDSLLKIQDSPLYAYHQTTAALASRVAFYAEKAGIQ